jgi:coenzyme PQQ synthesis protein D (PqqD)
VSAGEDRRRWVVSSDLVSSQVKGETVILHMGSETYFGLDLVGTHVWTQLSEPRTFAELRDGVVARFAVEPEQAGEDLRRLLAELEAEGLVRPAPS